MNNMIKKVTSIMLSIVMITLLISAGVVSVGATQNRYYNFNSGYSISGNGANDMVSVAAAQVGLTGSQLGYSEQWCADFVSDCAILSNQSDAIPAAGYCPTLRQNIINSGGWYVDRYSAQAGDIVFYGNNGADHVEIVYAASGGNVSTYGGNSGSAGNLYARSVKQHATQTQSIAYIVRPNYKDENPIIIPTGTQTISDGEYHIVSMLDDNKGIDVYGASLDNCANIDLYSNLSSSEQVFDVTYLGDGSYKIINKHSGKSLDCDGAGTTPGTNLQQYDYVGEPQQQWIIQETGDGESFYIISKKSGLCIDVDNASTADFTNIKLYTPNQSNAQKWKFIAWGGTVGRTVSDGEYHIASRLNTSMCLDVYAADKANSANIDLFTNITTPEQVFVVSYLGNGYYKIINKNSGKSLDLNGGKCVKGTNIQQWEYDDVDQQKWIIKPTSDNKAFYIVSKKGGLCIDVYNGEAKDLQNVQGYIANGTEAQQWRFIPWFDKNEQTIANGEYRIVSGVDETKALDIDGAKTDNMTKLQLYSNLNDKKQTFDIEYNNDGSYYIKSHYSKKPIDVEGNKCVRGTNIVIYDNNNGDNQKWRINPDNNGYCSIVSCSCGLSLDIDGGNSEDLTRVQVWTQNDTIAQKWKLRRVLNDDMVTVSDITVKSETDEVNPEITVTVDENTIARDGNYQVEISTDIANGKGTVTVIGIGNYCDSVTKEFKINVDPDILGDADGDGDISILDATIIQRYLAEFAVPHPEKTEVLGDVTGDGLDIIDATLIQRYLAEFTVNYPIGEPIT